jgi:hypothetical protein
MHTRTSEYSFSLGNCSVPYIPSDTARDARSTPLAHHEQQVLAEMSQPRHIVLRHIESREDTSSRECAHRVKEMAYTDVEARGGLVAVRV